MSIKITLYEFKLLPEQEQYYITFTKGDFLEAKIYGNQGFALYAVDKFFVEVEYDNRKNSIVEKKAFVKGGIMDKYLNSPLR